jgi:hypothetical protein
MSIESRSFGILKHISSRGACGNDWGMPGNFTGWNLKYAMHQHDLKKLVKKGAAEGREYERQLIKENESKLLEEIKAVGVACYRRRQKAVSGENKSWLCRV